MRQPIIIENRAGAGGNIGIGAVAKSAPDGYTLGVAAAGVLTVNPHLNRAAMPFDPLKDLAPVTLLARNPVRIGCIAEVGNLDSVADIIAKAKAQPQNLSIGHGGNGTAMHLTSALFTQKADIGIQLIAYRGTAPAAVDVLAGHVPLAVLDIPASQQLIKRGQAESARGLRRQGAWRSCPTFRRSRSGPEGIQIGRLVRNGRARGHVARNGQHVERGLREGIERSRGDREDPRACRRTRASSTGSFVQFIQSESAKWGKLIAETGIKSE